MPSGSGSTGGVILGEDEVVASKVYGEAGVLTGGKLSHVTKHPAAPLFIASGQNFSPSNLAPFKGRYMSFSEIVLVSVEILKLPPDSSFFKIFALVALIISSIVNFIT